MENKNEVKKLENVLIDNLKEKLKNDIAGMIPDDALETMILEEVKKFESIELPKMIKEELKTQFTEKVKTLGNKVISDYCSTKWEKDSKLDMTSKLEEFVKENMMSILANSITAPLQMMVQSISINSRTCTSCSSFLNFQGQGNCQSCGSYNY